LMAALRNNQPHAPAAPWLAMQAMKKASMTLTQIPDSLAVCLEANKPGENESQPGRSRCSEK
jgi:hypothetical protein